MLKAVDEGRVGAATVKNDVNYVISAMREGMKTGQIPNYNPINQEDVKINANWVRENAATMTALSMGGAAAGAAISGDAESFGALPSVESSIYNTMQAIYSHAVAAPHNTGSNTPDYFTSNRLKGFWLFHRTITNEFARKIDGYFTRFGYAQHVITVPNIHARNRFTYIKTVDCVVHGDLPADAGDMIQNIFDSGITFWADHDNVGNYSLDNPIYTGG